MDDFAYIIDTKSRRGFFTSNNGDSRNDNIYKFLEIRKLECIQELYGVDASRLTGRGYGETQLVNECADGIDCTEEQHQMNRRSEFIISNL